MRARYDELWEIRPKFLLHTLQVKSRLKRENSLKLIRGEMRPSDPVEYYYNLGSIARDLIPTAAVGRYLMRERVFTLLREKAFTGWLSYRVSITGEDHEEIRGYEGLQITGRAGDQDTSRGVLLLRAPGTLIQKKGLFFRDDEWDGSDFFLCNLRVCVTDRVRTALESIGVDNVDFIRLDSVRTVTTSGMGQEISVEE